MMTQALERIQKDKAVSAQVRLMAALKKLGCSDGEAVRIHASFYREEETDAEIWLTTLKSLVMLVEDKLHEARNTKGEL